ncbi:MAG: MYXO-CTERM sorting domain-containing protein [Deltaproteobacteria bacterium]|nr:MYXO-CTERM sorting domain-containing protein [Deltaproteobacteria bacterium]
MRTLSLRLGIATALTLAAGFVAAPVAHAAPLLRSFGGPEGFGTNVLPSNDDGSSSALDLTGAFSGGLRFFGGPYTEFYVNNNGNISFNDDIFAYTPDPFPVADQPMIAPYWGDVDTRNRTDISSPSENLVYWHLEPGRLVVTWYDVGYYSSSNDKRMSFQLILTNALDCGSGDFDVEFRYETCEWTAGSASGGTNGLCSSAGCTSAQAGFDAGNEEDYVALPGSFTDDILDVCTTSNVGLPGIWRFSVRSGGVVCASDMPCDLPDEVGPCAVGRTQCVGTETVCQPVTSPVDEICDGVDNDCNGEPDDGSDLCGAAEVCYRGSCVDICFEGSCQDGFTCDRDTGSCVADACVGVECEVGERCSAGSCVDACDGIVCPFGTECVSGSCVDPCASVTCGDDQFCREGLCVNRCPCSPCPSGETCNADGTCTPRGCDIINCPEGFYCEDGACHNWCEGVVCPSGQECVVDTCMVPPPVMRPDGGMPDDGDAGVADAGTDTMDGSTDVDGGRDIGDGGGDDGCGCRVAGSSSSNGGTGAFVLFGLLGLALVQRRRNR